MDRDLNMRAWLAAMKAICLWKLNGMFDWAGLYPKLFAPILAVWIGFAVAVGDADSLERMIDLVEG